ncbi:hypothetical protein EC988_001367 [Linderina pennispora]|nr:hypothetical protein EC988_001367 [Linderina pennispora]
MLKAMSLGGSLLACSVTGGVMYAQSQGQLQDDDLSTSTLVMATSVSLLSTFAVSRLFSPFVIRVTLLPARRVQGIQLDKHGLPKFDSIISTGQKHAAKAGSDSKVQALLARGVTSDSELVFETPGFFGLNTKTTRLRIRDLKPSSTKIRTWDVKESAWERMKQEKAAPMPLKKYTIMWKSSKNTPNRRIMQDIDSLIGSQ